VREVKRSRPVRSAAQLASVTEAEAHERFSEKCVLVRLADEWVDDADARETFLFAVNLCLRFVDVAVATDDIDLNDAASELAREITGMPLATRAPDITLVVGWAMSHNASTVVICSDGWLARLATSASAIEALPPRRGNSNVLGALAAACLGASQVFHYLAGVGLAVDPVELSLLTLDQGPLGSLAPGPPLPDHLDLDALLVGCGGVMHGFVYALKRLDVFGRARAVDRQRLREENFGPYVLATFAQRGVKKAQVVRDYLAPAVNVTPYDEDFYPLFTTRLDRGHFPVPPVVVSGLDRVTPRHIVQRLWPDLLIDMGAGGETAQLIVKRRDSTSACVLELLDSPTGEDELTRLAAESGFAPEAIRDAMDAEITHADVAQAPAPLQAAMEQARRQGQLRCGFIRTRALDHEQTHDDFVAAVPYVVAFTGVLAAAELVKQLTASSGGLRYQFSFASLRGRCVEPRAGACECRAA
jgi:hypothetical protein